MPVVILMRHADAEAFKPAFGTPDRRPLSSLGRVQADTVAWRIACSFGHAAGGESLPDSKVSRSGRTGIRAATGKLVKAAAGELPEPEAEGLPTAGVEAPDGVPQALPTIIRSSPALRCMQSAAPLIELLGTPVEPMDVLREDREFDILRDLLPELGDVQRAVVVTHLPQVEATLARLGVGHLGPPAPASAFRLLLSGDGRLIGARRV